MTLTSGPFNTGAGASFAEDSWSWLIGAAVADGVIQQGNALIDLLKFAVSADSSIMGVYVATGRAVVRGHYVANDATASVTLTAAHATLSRLDRIVLKLDRSADEITLDKVTGTAAGSPVAPALTRDNTIWMIPLAEVLVDPAVGIIAAGKVTDDRLYAGPQYKQMVNAASGDTCSTSIEDLPGADITMTCDGGPVIVTFGGTVFAGTPTAATRVYLQVDGGADTQIGEFSSQGANQTGQISRAYPVPAALVPVGRHRFKIRWSCSSGTGNISAGYSMFIVEFR